MCTYLIWRILFVLQSTADSQKEQRTDSASHHLSERKLVTSSSHFPLYRCAMIQTAAFSSSAFLLGYYTLKSSEAAPIERSKSITVSEMLQFYLKRHTYAYTDKLKGHANSTAFFPTATKIWVLLIYVNS